MTKRKITVGDFILGQDEKEVINKVLEGGRISEGTFVRLFEEEWSKFIGTRHTVATSSGTAALICGLSALKYHPDEDKKINENSKIITTPITYIATTHAIKTTGFEPVYVDVDLKTFGITPEKIKEHLEKIDDIEKYSLILPVHLMGFPCDMNNINKIAKKYGLKTFEDSAQAHGTTYHGKKTGSLSMLSIFSFYIAHNVQAGEMGAINTDDYDIARLVKKIKANGRMCDCLICVRTITGCPRIKAHKGDDDFDPRFTHDLIGYNFKTMEFQAALAYIQIKKAEWIIKKRQENVKYLNEYLEKYLDILQLPIYSDEVSYLAYPIVIKKPTLINRKKIRNELECNGIETRPLFGCIPTQQPAYSYLKKEYEGKLPNAEYLGKNAFYIGCHQYLTQEDLDYIIKKFREILQV